MIRKSLRAAALLLALAGPAIAAPVDARAMDELVGWGACAAAIGIFEGTLQESGGSDADRDLLDRAHVVEPRMKAYFDSAAGALDGDQTEELKRRVAEPILARMLRHAGQPDAQTQLLAEFRPDLEACVTKAQALPEPPIEGSKAT